MPTATKSGSTAPRSVREPSSCPSTISGFSALSGACGFPRKSFKPVVTLCARAGHVTTLSVRGAEHPHDTCYATPLPEQLYSATLFARLVALRPCDFAAGGVSLHGQASEASRWLITGSADMHWLIPEHSRHALRRLRCPLRNPIFCGFQFDRRHMQEQYTEK